MTTDAWRIGDVARCGANLVRIAALDDGRALVVGGGPFGPWSIWTKAARLQRAERKIESALPPALGMKLACRAPKPAAGHPIFIQLLQRRNDAQTVL